jgi:hypothetical protein
MSRRALGGVLVVVVLSAAAPARAIPAFARKYQTSCLTCHTVYPKLNPFGEAFRRNGYRFPGTDSDYIKAEQIAMGQEANKKTFPKTAWPDSILAAIPIAVGANGQAKIVPSSGSSAGEAAKSADGAATHFTVQDLVAEAHIWGGAALDDTITVWFELTFSSDGVDVEHAQLLFNDIVGPKHLFNLIVGHGFPNVTDYGPHSSYLADSMVTTVPVTGIYWGNSDPWTLVDNYTGLELNGVIAGRFDYAVGLNAGKIAHGLAPTDNFYGRLGFKLGGMRLDGEDSSGPPDPDRPWAETALGVYAFAYQSNSRFDTSAGAPVASDTANTYGIGVRGQLSSAELNLGWYTESHGHGTDTGGPVKAQVLFGELSYVVFPWMVPALRVETVWLAPEGVGSIHDLHIQPGIAFLIRPNIKLVAVFDYESARGFPTTAGGPLTPGPQAWQGGASDWGPLQIAPPSSGASTRSEFESIGIYLAWAM